MGTPDEHRLVSARAKQKATPCSGLQRSQRKIGRMVYTSPQSVVRSREGEVVSLLCDLAKFVVVVGISIVTFGMG